MNLLPELLRQAKSAVATRAPMLRHLVFDYPADALAQRCHDEFMLGDLLVAPVLTEGAESREVYLPEGRWYGFLTKETLEGGQTVRANANRNRIPVYLRTPGAVALNLPEDLLVGGFVGNRTDQLDTPVLAVSGVADLDYEDGFGNRAVLRGGAVEQANIRVLDVSALRFAEEL